jgi:hypothetical protein
MQSDPPDPPSSRRLNPAYARFNTDATPQLQQPQSVSATPQQLVSAIKTRHEVLERFSKAGGKIKAGGMSSCGSTEYLKRSAALSRHAIASRPREALQAFDRESASMLEVMRLRANEFDDAWAGDLSIVDTPLSTPGNAPLVHEVLMNMLGEWPPNTDSRKFEELLDISAEADMDDPTIYETLMASFPEVRDIYNEGRRRVGGSTISD